MTARVAWAVARAALGTALLCAAGCAGLLIERAGGDPLAEAPVIDVAQRALPGGKARGAQCAGPVEVVHGRVPDDAAPLFALDMTSARPAALRSFEDTARERASQACANGVSVLRATDAEGRGYLEVTVALWERAPVTPREP